MSKKTKEYRKMIADAFVKSLQEDPIGWRKMWSGSIRPQNGHTGRKYTGLNRLWLQYNIERRGFEDPRFYTFKQVQDMGLKVKKGSKAVQVEFWSLYDPELKKTVDFKDAKEYEEQGKELKTIARYYSVFNGSQVEGLEKYEFPKLSDARSQEVIENIAKNMGVKFLHDGMDQAFYRQSDDSVHLPRAESFLDQESYNATALHELAHATGSPKRLNRTQGKYFGDEPYAREELVAEITSCFSQNDLGLSVGDEHFDNHKAYIHSWISEISEKEEALIEAIKDAQAAADYILETSEKEKVLNPEEYIDHIDKKEVQTELNPEKEVGRAYIQIREEADLKKDIPLPNIRCDYSESAGFEKGKIYSVHEFDERMRQLDNKYVLGKEIIKIEFGSIEEAIARGEHRYIGYEKVGFTVNLKNGTSFSDRQDIGDDEGGVIDHLSRIPEFAAYMPELIEARDKEAAKEQESMKELETRIKEKIEQSKEEEQKEQYYRFSDGFFSYYVNKATGERKFELGEKDMEVEADLDDFISGHYVREDTSTEANMMTENKTVYVKINKAFVQADIQSKTDPERTFNRVTMPKNTIVNGKDIGGFSFYPTLIYDDLTVDNLAAIPWRTDRAITLHKGQEEVKVDPTQLKEALNTSYKEWRNKVREEKRAMAMNRQNEAQKEQQAEME